MDNICEGILQYSVHAERPGSLRYAKVLTPLHLRSLTNGHALEQCSFNPGPVDPRGMQDFVPAQY